MLVAAGKNFGEIRSFLVKTTDSGFGGFLYFLREVIEILI